MSSEKTMIVDLNNNSTNGSVICLDNMNVNVNQSHYITIKRKIVSNAYNKVLKHKRSILRVDSSSSSSLSSDNPLKQCKLQLDHVLQAQSLFRMKYDRDGNTLFSSSLEDDTNTKKSLSSYGSRVFHEDESKKYKPWKIK